MQTTKFVKQPVAVSVIVEKDGRVFPKKFLWKDGHTYKIDRVMRVERAASTKVGGCGIRYTVMVEGLPRYGLCVRQCVKYRKAIHAQP